MDPFNDLPRRAMTAIVFDTLAYAEKLEAAGFTHEQAKGQAHALREIIDDQIATKQDLAALDASVSARLAETKAELIKWYIGTMFAMTALVVGLVKLIH
ncbi:hypothetical protein B0G57_102445 [Trinickia symbiotica]|nr:hypothetical protein [Trinickia symbiotica]PPK46850.1 hypothetical protein B0G57_102445 [Trinickia symbiotica]